MWGSEASLEHFLQTLVALLDAPADLPPEMLQSIDKPDGGLPGRPGPVG
jgi:hypothetical protein